MSKAKFNRNPYSFYTVLLALMILMSAATQEPANAKSIAKPKLSAPTSAQRHIVHDDGEKSSFAEFRRQLIEAVKHHDKAFVDAALSPDIALALGGGKGKQAFYEEWQGLQADSEFWPRIERVLIHGVQLDAESGEYHAPAVSFDDSHSELPQAVVWTKQAALRQSPNSESPIVATLYDEQITILEPAEAAPMTAKWAKVKTSAGKTGYMKAEDFYSAYDEFAVFKRANGKWVLTWFGFAGL
ncbi:MAG: SH3 domain-containing protein [Candidatus Obscuribacterales bacterium]|nr:SH3 domain-containing protein [Candidatus Obscuribacterales bacterium]